MLASLPANTLKEMNATDCRLYELLYDMITRRRNKHGSHGGYIMPSEAWLAQRLGRCRQAISESVSKLKHIGLVWVVQRRPIKGKWQTNLYRLMKTVFCKADNIKKFVFSKGLPCRLLTTLSRDYKKSIPSRQEKDSGNVSNRDESLSEVMERVFKKVTFKD